MNHAFPFDSASPGNSYITGHHAMEFMIQACELTADSIHQLIVEVEVG
ncbi:MAG TPA: hypothetical protein VFZ78_09040 [Flavisolibacter sp.]